jgi:hypothetical protein
MAQVGNIMSNLDMNKVINNWHELFLASPKVLTPDQWEVWMVMESLLLYEKKHLSDQEMEQFQDCVLGVFDVSTLIN